MSSAQSFVVTAIYDSRDQLFNYILDQFNIEDSDILTMDPEELNDLIQLNEYVFSLHYKDHDEIFNMSDRELVIRYVN